MSVITVVGAGMMGSAMAYPARANGHEVRIVGTPLDESIIDQLRQNDWHLNLKRTLPEGCRYFRFEGLDEALCGADVLVGGVSSFGVDWFIENVIPRVPETLPVLSITKGMYMEEDGSLISYPELYRRSTDRKISFNAVGGPCTSYELADRDPTEIAFCGWDMALLERLRAMFETDFYHISLSTDVRGVECAVAMKNAYALGVSLAIGMSYKREGRQFEHYNSQAALFGQSVREMARMLSLCGQSDTSPDNLALGVGDLYVTVFGGRTRRIGTLLGEGLSFDEAMDRLSGVTLESIVIARRTVEAIGRMAKRGAARAEDFPLLAHIGRLIDPDPAKRADAGIPWDAFERSTDVAVQ